MSKRDDAVNILPKLLEMIVSDAEKTSHYLEKAVTVAFVADNKLLLVKLHQHLEDLKHITESLQEELEEL